jgi:hypothetical protein
VYPVAHEITVSWDKSPTPGVSYNVFRGTAPGNESVTPYATSVMNPNAENVSSIVSNGAQGAFLNGSFSDGANNGMLGMKVTVEGATNQVNNGQFTVLASTATQLTIANANSVNETNNSTTVTARPFFTDTNVIAGKIYVYKITAVLGGTESVDSVEIISPAVPFDASPAFVDVGTASSFEILAGSAVTNTGATQAAGDVGVSPGSSITGFGPPALISGVFHSADFVAAAAQHALTGAYNDAQGRTGAVTLTGDIGGQTLKPGVYNSASSLAITGTLVLDAGGNPDAVWIFQIGSTLTTAVSNSDVLLLNGAQAQNVFWAVGSSATLNGGTNFVGTIMAQASITVGNSVNVNGRLLARTGAVTLDTDIIQMFLSAALAIYKSNTFYAVGTIIFDCATQTYQQVAIEGTTGASRPAFNAAVGATTQDGTVLWVSLDPPLVTVTTGLPPSPPNVPPAPPAAPTNPSISSED